MHSAIRSLQFIPKAAIGPRADGCDPVLTDGPGAAEWRAQNSYAPRKSGLRFRFTVRSFVLPFQISRLPNRRGSE
jgi:hypothetical protein